MQEGQPDIGVFQTQGLEEVWKCSLQTRRTVDITQSDQNLYWLIHYNSFTNSLTPTQKQHGQKTHQ